MNDDLLWFKNERNKVLEYLSRNVESYNDLSECPAFDVAPYFAIWAVESSMKHGFVGFWAFSGDLPTDVIVRDWEDDSDNPRKALGRQLATWREYVISLNIGHNPKNITMGNSNKERMNLGNLLEKRILLLVDLYLDDNIWNDDCKLA